MRTNVSGMVIPLAKPAQRWLYDVTSSGYFRGLVMARMAILGAGYVVASSGSVSTRVVPVGCRSTAAICWSLSRPLVLWGVGLFRVVLAADVELCLGVVALQCMVMMTMMGGCFARAPFSRWVGLGFPPGGFSGSLPLRDAGHAHIRHCWFWQGGVPCHSCGSLLSRVVVGRFSPSLLCVRVLAWPLVAVAAARCAAGLHTHNLAGVIVPPGGVDSPPPGCMLVPARWWPGFDEASASSA